MVMIYLEKISTEKSKTYSKLKYSFSDAMDHPGLIGIFYNNPEFGDEIKKQCKEADIGFGEKFGADGVTVDALLQLTSPMLNYWFEISSFDFMELSLEKRELLIDIYNIIVYDYIDGGYHVELYLPTHYINDPRILNASGAFDTFGNDTLCIHVFPLITYSETMRTGNNVPESVIDLPKDKRCFFPNHKPRPGRLKALARLDELDILDHQVDWSLTVNFDEDGELGDYFKSPNVGLGRYGHSLEQTDSVIKFVNKYKGQLPKVLPNSTIELFRDCIPLNKRYAGRYTWKIACETYPHIKFNTEKTFKGMMAGMPVLTLGPAGLNKGLVDAGYIMEYSELYDHLEFGDERIEAVIDVMVSKQPNLEAVKHNYKLSHDVEFLASLIVNPLKKKLVTRQ
tara:strand:+ start:566 stop:1753 length:1188 start_codon:yes stop_codon:yes gene_type:complete